MIVTLYHNKMMEVRNVGRQINDLMVGHLILDMKFLSSVIEGVMDVD